jgi:molecular chaperone HscB
MFLCPERVLVILVLSFFRERGYDITENSLEGKYKEWQKKLHPDLAHTKSEVSAEHF